MSKFLDGGITNTGKKAVASKQELRSAPMDPNKENKIRMLAGDIFRRMNDKKMNLDKHFQAPKEANALCAQFDDHNGDYDSPGEFLRAYIQGDLRAAKSLKTQHMGKLREYLCNEYPEIRDMIDENIETPQEMTLFLDTMRTNHKMEWDN